MIKTANSYQVLLVSENSQLILQSALHIFHQISGFSVLLLPFSSSSGSSWPKDQTHVSYVSSIAGGFFICSAETFLQKLGVLLHRESSPNWSWISPLSKFPIVKFTWDSYKEIRIRCLMSKVLFIYYQCVPLPCKALSTVRLYNLSHSGAIACSVLVYLIYTTKSFPLE